MIWQRRCPEPVEGKALRGREDIRMKEKG